MKKANDKMGLNKGNFPILNTNYLILEENKPKNLFKMFSK